MSTPTESDKSWVDSLIEGTSGFKKSICESISGPLGELKAALPLDTVDREIIYPLNKLYRSWPSQLAEFKRESVLPVANENNRLIFLGLSTLLVVGVTKRCMQA